GVFIVRARSQRLTIVEALKRYIAEVTPTKRPQSQIGDRQRAVILSKHLGRYWLAALTPEIVTKFRDERLTGTDRKDKDGNPIPRASNTVRLELGLLRHLYNIAINEWLVSLPWNPVMHMRRLSPGPGRNRRLTADEERRLFEAVDKYSNPMLRMIVRIALETGMRSSEIVTLRQMQVDLNRRVVRLVETKNTMPRTVPLSAVATEMLREAIDNPVRPIDTDLIFYGEPGRDGKRHPYYFKAAWQRIKTSLGLENLHFHDLRHEAVSRFVEARFTDQEVSAISGHRSMQMLKRYTHLRAENLVPLIDAAPKHQPFEPGKLETLPLRSEPDK
ncbi:MAG: site-specific integrase, partial [Acidobacteriaceae bacterium]|nr:site-specific integrase [Acidobacteriaceae bacterium]